MPIEISTSVDCVLAPNKSTKAGKEGSILNYARLDLKTRPCKFNMRRPSLLILLSLLCFPAPAEWIRSEVPIMGTRIYVELWHEDEGCGENAAAAVIEEMRRIDRLMSSYKPESQVSRINRDAAISPVTAGPELIELILDALELSELTQGAFDITYASVGYLYDYRQRTRPDAAEIRDTLPAVDYRHVVVDPKLRTVSFKASGVRIDLGGIAKGYAVERGVEILRKRGVDHAIVTAGGDSRILGDRRGRPWVVGIRDPRNRGKISARIPLVDEAISTSGDYERYFEEDGIRYHHILNPSTGKSARSVRSVTIVGPEATRTDGLSTSVFVLGVEAGMALVDRLPEAEAVIVDKEGKLYYSSGLESGTGDD